MTHPAEFDYSGLIPFLPEWAKWIAADKDGLLFIYELKPFSLGSHYDRDCKRSNMGTTPAHWNCHDNWKKSLRRIKR